jgi:adenylate kinase
MNILMFGPQGSGKGTQARLLCEKYGLFYFESGAFLRRLAETNENIREIMAQGSLVPDAEMTSYVTAYLDSKGLYDNIIFDGFPRSIHQYNILKNWLQDKEVNINLLIVIQISEAESVKRLMLRRQDPKTGEIYSLNDLPDGIMESGLVQRDDDKPDAIRRRLGLYRERTEALISALKNQIPAYEISGERRIEEIQSEIQNIVEKYKNGN